MKFPTFTSSYFFLGYKAMETTSRKKFHLFFTFFFLTASIASFSQTVLDSSYGTNGKAIVQTGFENYDSEDYYYFFNSACATKDSGVLRFQSENYYMAPRDILRKFTKTGQVDTTFGNHGSIEFGGMGGKAIVLNDGKILVCYYYESFFGAQESFTIVRLLPDGHYDATFSGGYVRFTAGEGAPEIVNGIAVKNNGKIVVAGLMSYNPHLVVFQLLPNGQTDTSFGSEGYLHVKLPEETTANDVIALPNNKIAVAYTSALVQYNDKGKIDSSAGDNGVYRNVSGGRLYLNKRSLYMAAGSVIYKFSRGGVPDSTFGTNGILQQNSSYDPYLSFDKKGNFYLNSSAGFALTKYTMNGVLDTTFGNKGTASTTFQEYGYTSQSADAPVVIGDNKVVLVGKVFGNYIDIGLAAFKTTSDTPVPLVTAVEKNSIAARIAKATTISLYPNPVHATLTINGLPPTGLNVRIVGSTGTTIQTYYAATDSYKIDVSKLTAGTYYVVMSGINKTLKFIKE